MKNGFRLKTWAGPLTIGSFVVLTVTGILMFFHLNFGAVKLAHEWLSLVFVAGALAHLAVNWKPLLAYFRKPVGVGIISAILLVGALSLVPFGGGSHGHPLMAVARALEQSPLTLVAEVAQRSPQTVVEELKAQGLQVQNESQTISEIASENQRQSMEILNRVLGQR